MRFASPYWLYLLALLPLLAIFYVWAMQRRNEAIEKLASSRFRSSLVSAPPAKKRWQSHILVLAGLSLLVAALARPQFGQRPEEKERRGLDLEFMLDASMSMAAVDVSPDRFGAAKVVVRDVLKELKGDRVGLTMFTNSPLRVLPFTTDYGAFEYFLDMCDMKVFLNWGTNIETSVRETVPVFERKGGKSKVIVILSDGEDEPGLDYKLPEDILAADLHVYVFGVGTESGGTIPLRAETEQIVGYMKDSSGRDIVTRMEEATLKKVAQGYGGRYYSYTQDSIKKFISDLDDLKNTMIEDREEIVYEDYFQYFLIAGLLLIFAGKGISED